MVYEGFLAGTLSGMAQVISGHPLDSWKTWRQGGAVGGDVKGDIKGDVGRGTGMAKPTVRSLYRGVAYPFFSSGVINGIMFGTQRVVGSWGNENGVETSPWVSGAIAGAVSSVVASPVERYKISRQFGGEGFSLKRFRAYGVGDAFLGFRLTLLRETASCGIYFGVYDWMRKREHSVPVAGGVAGMSCWGCLHPLDTVKTRVQSGQALDWRTAMKEGGLWRGVSASLLRAGVVNAVGFTVYEWSLKFWAK